MPWKECSAVSCREEFVGLAQAEWAKMSELCRRFGVSRKTGYKWLRRYASAGVSGLLDRSRRPRGSPGRTSEAMEGRVLAVRTEHPAWGGRKIRRVLLNAGHQDVPSASTITAILHRHGLIDEAESSKHKAWMRFEHERPNDLWQMDFKGHFAMDRDRCHPLTVLDDHSRYCVGLEACGNERGGTVRERLTGVFRRYGLPRRMLMDNGSPWGSDADHPWTPLTVWLLRLGVGVSHGRPYHPQTQGKDERFHRTLKAEVLSGRSFENLLACQNAFDDWRETYNVRRPHEALELNTPITRYAVSSRCFPEALQPIEYGPEDTVRRVYDGGQITLKNREYRVGKAFRGNPVALRPTLCDGVLDVYFCTERIGWIDERTGRWGRTTREDKTGRGGLEESPSGCQASVRSAHSGPAAGGVPRNAGGP